LRTPNERNFYARRSTGEVGLHIKVEDTVLGLEDGRLDLSKVKTPEVVNLAIGPPIRSIWDVEFNDAVVREEKHTTK